MGLRFTWDPRKAAANLEKHGIPFEEGMTIFADPDEVMLPDPDHSEEEERFVSIGKASGGELVLACYTEHEDLIRLISVRKATAKESQIYQRRGDQDA